MAAPVILVEASPRRVADGVVQIVRLAGGGDQQPYTYGGLDWWAGLSGLPTIIADLQFEGGTFGEGSVPQAIELTWAPASIGPAAARLAELAALYWGDASVTVRIGPEVEGVAPALPPIVLTGKVLECTAPDGRLKLSLADPAAGLKQPLLTAGGAGRYLGTGGLEGPAEWAKKLKRRIWGRAWNVPGEPLDKANNIYCFADPQQRLQDISAVRDRGASAAALTVLAWQGSAAATFAALQAAAAPSGGGVCAPSIGCVKWWTQPGGLNADLKGEIGAGYVETAAGIAARLVSVLGGVNFAAGTVAAATALRPAPCGVMVDSDTMTVAALLDELLADVSLLWLLDSAGEIVIRPWAWSASVAAANSLSATRAKVFAPVAGRKLGYQRNSAPMARGDIAGIVFADNVTYPNGQLASDLQPQTAGATRNRTSTGGTAPVDAADGDIWIDTSVVPTYIRTRIGGIWPAGGNVVTGTAQIADTAGLGQTANWPQVSGAGLPESNATANDNMIKNGSLSTGTTFWYMNPAPASAAVQARVPGTAADPVPAFWRFTGNAADVRGNDAATFGVTGNSVLFVSLAVRSADVVNTFGAMKLWEFDATGALLANDTVFINGTANNTWRSLVIPKQLRPTTARAWLGLGRQDFGGTAAALDIGNIRVSQTEPNADVTLTAAVVADLAITTKSVNADYLGALIGSPLPVTFSPSVNRSGVSVKTLDLMSYAITRPSDGAAGADGGTATVNNTNGSASKGDVAVTAFNTNSIQVKFRLTVSYNAIIVGVFDCILNKVIGDPPSGGAGGGGGGASKLAIVPANQATTSTSYVPASSSANPSLVVASGEKLYAAATLGYTAGTGTGGRSGTFKHQYSTDNSSWSDFGGAVTGSNATTGNVIGGETIDPVAGSVTINQDVAPGAGTFYLRTVFLSSNSSRQVVLSGDSIVYEAKP